MLVKPLSTNSEIPVQAQEEELRLNNILMLGDSAGERLTL